MFNFNREDPCSSGSVRLRNLRHNPYVGSFSHCVSVRNNILPENHMLLGNTNPLIGTFRHSPPVFGFGIKGLFFGIHVDALQRIKESVQPHIYPRDNFSSSPSHLSLADLNSIPVSKYIDSLSSDPGNNNADHDNDDKCVICLDCFENGVDIRTLPCSHCFHRDCIDIWFLGSMSDDSQDTSNCPQCRQHALAPVSVDIDDDFLTTLEVDAATQPTSALESISASTAVAPHSLSLAIGNATSVEPPAHFSSLSVLPFSSSSSSSSTSQSSPTHSTSLSVLRLSPTKLSTMETVVRSSTSSITSTNNNNSNSNSNNNNVVSQVILDSASGSLLMQRKCLQLLKEEEEFLRHKKETEEKEEMEWCCCSQLSLESFSDCGIPL